eukprot:1135728-Rhodomonas_salina.3
MYGTDRAYGATAAVRRTRSVALRQVRVSYRPTRSVIPFKVLLGGHGATRSVTTFVVHGWVWGYA